jgi:hypothetical protein
MTSPLHPAWVAWLASTWPELERGGRACAPPGLPHPRDAGFSRPWASEAHGQTDDWTASVGDGSRVHVHEYPGGSLIVHRDRVDPARGPLSALWHFVTETTLGGALVKAGAVTASIMLWRRFA